MRPKLSDVYVTEGGLFLWSNERGEAFAVIGVYPIGEFRTMSGELIPALGFLTTMKGYHGSRDE